MGKFTNNDIKFEFLTRASKLYLDNPKEDSHPERQSSSTNQTSQSSSSLELFARDLQRNGRFRLGLRTGITLARSSIDDFFVAEATSFHQPRH